MASRMASRMLNVSVPRLYTQAFGGVQGRPQQLQIRGRSRRHNFAHATCPPLPPCLTSRQALLCRLSCHPLDKVSSCAALASDSRCTGCTGCTGRSCICTTRGTTRRRHRTSCSRSRESSRCPCKLTRMSKYLINPVGTCWKFLCGSWSDACVVHVA